MNSKLFNPKLVNQINLENVNCSVCGNNHTELISTKGQFNIPITLVGCKVCGLAYLNPRWTREKYLDFYINDYDKYYRPQVGKTTYQMESVLVLRWKHYKLPGNEESKILEIGSGAGVNLISLGHFLDSKSLYAIEPSAASQKVLKAKGIEVLNDDVYSEWEEIDTKFDIILMRHVLEHMLDPVHILKKIRSALSETGIGYIAVPNNLNPTKSLSKVWFRVVHTYYFNRYSLTAVLGLAGLDIIHMVENDANNKGEVYCFVKKGEIKVNTPNVKHFLEQNQLFKSFLKKEKKSVYILKEYLKICLEKLKNKSIKK